MVESVFRGSLGTADPFNLRARAAFAFFGVAFGVARLISPRLASTVVTAESCCIVLDNSTVARYRFAASMSSTHVFISLVADRILNSRTSRLSICSLSFVFGVVFVILQSELQFLGEVESHRLPQILQEPL